MPNDYVEKHGKDAPVLEARRCDQLLHACDYEGSRNYQAIISRINHLLEPRSEGPLH